MELQQSERFHQTSEYKLALNSNRQQKKTARRARREMNKKEKPTNRNKTQTVRPENESARRASRKWNVGRRRRSFSSAAAGNLLLNDDSGTQQQQQQQQRPTDTEHNKGRAKDIPTNNALVLRFCSGFVRSPEFLWPCRRYRWPPPVWLGSFRRLSEVRNLRPRASVWAMNHPRSATASQRAPLKLVSFRCVFCLFLFCFVFLAGVVFFPLSLSKSWRRSTEKKSNLRNVGERNSNLKIVSTEFFLLAKGVSPFYRVFLLFPSICKRQQSSSSWKCGCNLTKNNCFKKNIFSTKKNVVEITSVEKPGKKNSVKRSHFQRFLELFYRFFSSFTGFYRVFRSFTGLPWVLPSFLWSLALMIQSSTISLLPNGAKWPLFFQPIRWDIEI